MTLRSTLESVARALSREEPVLSEHPGLLFQQLVGWLQWESGAAHELATREMNVRSAPGARRWAHLRTRVGAPEAFVGAMLGHAGAVEDCAIAPDGSWIVSLGDDRTVKLWDPATRRDLATLSGHAVRNQFSERQVCRASPDGDWFLSAGPERLKVWDRASLSQRGEIPTTSIPTCAISPDGSWFLASVGDDRAEIWEVEPLRQRAVLDGRGDRLGHVAISPDGRVIASSHASGVLMLWDAGTTALRSRIEGRTNGHAGPCEFGPDGTWILSYYSVYTEEGDPDMAEGETGGILKIWDVATGRRRATLTMPNEIGVCAVSPDGAWVVAGSSGKADATLKVWDAQTGDELATLTGHTDHITECAVSPDARSIVSSGWDGVVKVWDAPSTPEGHRQRARASLIGHSQGVVSLHVLPDGSSAVSASDDGSLRIWDLSEARNRAAVSGHPQEVHTCAASPDGSLFVSGGWDGTLMLWDASDGRERVTMRAHTDAIYDCVVSPDATWVASASYDETLRIFDLPDGRERAVLQGHTAPVVACAAAPDGSWLASGSWDNTVRVWDSRDGTELATLTEHEHWVEFCAVGPEGSWVLSQDSNGTVINWDTEGRSRTVYSGNHLTEVIAVSPDGTWMAVEHPTEGDDETIEDFTLAVLDPRNGVELSRLVGDSAPVEACASPDGRSLVSGGADGTLHIWSIGGDTDPITVRSQGGAIRPRAVSPDGRWIGSTSDDEIARVWDLRTGEQVALIALPWAPFCLSWHPHHPTLFLGGEHGMVALVDVIGIDHARLATPHRT